MTMPSKMTRTQPMSPSQRVSVRPAKLQSMALKLDRMTSDAMYMKYRTAEVIVAEKKSGAGKYGAISVHADNMMPMKVLLEA